MIGHGAVRELRVLTKSDHNVILGFAGCPDCGRAIVGISLHGLRGRESTLDSLAYPDAPDRPVPAEVEVCDSGLADDFREAVLVLTKSRKASAALSRRCLQRILSTRGGAQKRDLADQLDEVIPKLPTELANNVDHVRVVGNFAAHPTKSKSTGNIADVEPGEAEWNIEVIEQLFDYYYVAPARALARRAAMDTKLRDLGKPPLKTAKP